MTSLIQMQLARLSLLEAFQARHGVRTFKSNLTGEQKAYVVGLVKEANDIASPFGNNVEISIHEPGLGMVGMISNEDGWLIGKVKTAQKPTADESFDIAYKMQYVVMGMVQNNIGSAWISGTFKHDAAEKSYPGFKVIAGIPYGIPDTPSVPEKLMKWVMKSDKRKPISEMFFDFDNKRPFDQDNMGEKADYINSIRSGPSAKNAQTWRFTITDYQTCIFNNETSDVSNVDMGIAASNAVLLLKDYGNDVKIVKDASHPESPLGGSYVCSIVSQVPMKFHASPKAPEKRASEL